MSEKKPSLNKLEDQLGYRFQNQSLLKEALTHASARVRGARNNERLEFLGDRVLGLCIAALIFERFPEAREVELALRYNALVRENSCAAVAQSLDLGLYITMAPSETRSGGRTKSVILADACEALLGALFIDGGFSAADSVIARLWAPLLEKAEHPIRDAKTSLQEFAQSQKKGLPVYKELARAGLDHAPNFVVEVSVLGMGASIGEGPSLKKAQQAAAEAFLIRESLWPEKCGDG